MTLDEEIKARMVQTETECMKARWIVVISVLGFWGYLGWLVLG